MTNSWARKIFAGAASFSSLATASDSWQSTGKPVARGVGHEFGTTEIAISEPPQNCYRPESCQITRNGPSLFAGLPPDCEDARRNAELAAAVAGNGPKILF